MQGTVFDLKRFAVHDGDGIRTTLFFKGCPLACKWCHNPEGMSPNPQLALFLNKCSGCGACAAICPQSIDIPAALADLAAHVSSTKSWAEISRQRAAAQP